MTSATIDTERFARHFDDAPVINVEGRTFPVEVRYRPLEGEAGDDSDGEQGNGRDGERTVNDAIVAAIDEITRIDPRGDVLMFLPGSARSAMRISRWSGASTARPKWCRCTRGCLRRIRTGCSIRARVDAWCWRPMWPRPR